MSDYKRFTENVDSGFVDELACRIAYNKLCGIENQIEQGYIKILPVRAGDKIYVVPSKAHYGINRMHKSFKENNRVYTQTVDEVHFFKNGVYLIHTCDYQQNHHSDLFGETWFLEYEQAANRLKEMEAIYAKKTIDGERLTKAGGLNFADKNLSLADEYGYSHIYNRLAKWEDAQESGEIVGKEWHDEQVLHLQEENARLEKRNGTLLIEKDAMEANCIALQKQLDGVKTIGDWVYEVHKNAVQHGWYDGNGAKNFGELLMLVVTEVAEVMEEYRNGRLMKETYVNKNGKMCGIPSELADIVIRVMDICGYYNIDLEQAIAEKHEYNKSRPYKHGGKKC